MLGEKTLAKSLEKNCVGAPINLINPNQGDFFFNNSETVTAVTLAFLHLSVKLY